MADAIRQHHFDAAEGARIAAALEAQPQSAAPTASAQAQLWTQQLRDISGDLHFRAIYAPGSDLPPAASNTPATATGIADATRRADGLGLLVLTHFPPDSASQRAAYDAAMRTLANARALIIDVRDNRGGDPASVAYVLGFLFKRPSFVSMHFLSHGKVVAESRIDAGRAGLHFDESMPIAVLTSTRTFSGGEALAYELQAYRRACVFGETTGGAANPTLLLEMPHDYAISVPWQQPVHRVTGSSWEGRGVAPDVPVAAPHARAHAERALRAAPLNSCTPATERTARD